ncbi:hypothetical protein KZO83_04510 [Chromohalobacter sp. TMW 2.2308]|uniref:hypothetical protein n=1 Tax=Chromohalobacter TaxID=42054 RepID=UPI001FFC52FF|nr:MULTISPECIES: hypothetical protein [Chromohalobacter]MCK2041949.1 hypothetical protein [Chromohalobacter moromii]MCT8514097.1 hypothetical protein [Chromohalobacter sp. TMW 2.2271]
MTEHTDVYHPEDMPALKARLTRTKSRNCIVAFETLEIELDNSLGIDLNKCDRNSKRGPKPSSITNEVLDFMWCCMEVSDIPDEALNVLEGVARLNWYSRKHRSDKIVAPNPVVECPVVMTWRVLFDKCDRNSKQELNAAFTVRKHDDDGEWLLSPAGVTRNEYLRGLWQSKNNADSLSVLSMLYCLRELKEITTKGVQQVINVGERQARRYKQALGLCMPYLVEAYQSIAPEFDAGLVREVERIEEQVIFSEAA